MTLIDRNLLGEIVNNGNVHYEDIMNTPTVNVNNLIVKELEKIKEKIGRIETEEGGDFLERPAMDIIYEAQKIINNHIAELKGE